MKEENKNKVKIGLTVLQIVLIVTSIIMLLVGNKNNITISYIAILLVFLSNIIFCFKDMKKRILLFLFHGAFFVFLMGGEVVKLLKYCEVSYPFSSEIELHIILCLYLSLISLQIGFLLVEKFVKELSNNKKSDNIKLFKLQLNREEYKNNVRKYAKIVFIVGWIINLFMSFENIIYVANHSYLEFSKSFESQIPYFITVIANFRTIAFFVFLATIPSKKETRPILIMFVLEGILSLLFGDRGNCIIDILIVIFYIIFRQCIAEEKERWISKKQVIVIIVLIPFIFAFLSAFVFFREGKQIEEFSISNQIIRFFSSIGNSVNIVGYENQYQEELTNIGNFYTIGDIKQYVIYNPITEALFNIEHPTYHTEEYALSGKSFMHTISYLINPEKYIEGHGYGSSYIAELHIDFGYIGVAIGNLIIGAYMAIFNKIYKKSYVLTAAILLSYRIMFLLPRAPIDYLFTYVFNFTAILSILLILCLTIIEGYIKINRRKMINE